MMTTPVDLAETAAGVFVGAMSTDLWGLVKERCTQLVRRHGNAQEQGVLVRMDDFQQDLVSLPQEERETTQRVYERRVASELQPLTERSPEAADDLRQLVNDLMSDPRISSPGAVINSGQTFKNIKTGGGDFNFVGRDQITGGRA